MMEKKTISYKITDKGIKREFLYNEPIYIQGKIEEVLKPVINNIQFEIDVITLPDELVTDIDFDDHEHVLWTLYDDNNCISDEIETICENDDLSPYVWGSAIIKALGSYYITTFDFFEGNIVKWKNLKS